MDKEKKRKFHLVLYGIAIPVSLFALYTFIFVFDNGIGWKIALIIIGLGWLISAIGSVKNFVALVKNSSFLVRITDMTILIEKEFIYGSSKRPNPTDYYRK